MAIARAGGGYSYTSVMRLVASIVPYSVLVSEAGCCWRARRTPAKTAAQTTRPDAARAVVTEDLDLAVGLGARRG